MGIKHFGKTVMIGNFAKITRKKPEDWDAEYKIYVPYSPKFDHLGREKIGKVQCTCEKVLECYSPWYGFDWYHEDACALMVQLKEKPHLRNLWCYQSLPLLARTE